MSKILRFILCLSLLCGGLAACAQKTAGQTSSTPLPVATTLATDASITLSPATETPLPATATPVPRQFSQYTLTANFDYDQHHLKVDEGITYLNSSSEALTDLLLIVEPNRYPGAFQLATLAWEGNQPITRFSLQGNQLYIPLDKPLPPGEHAALSLSYELNLPRQEHFFGYTDQQANLGDWYPYVPPYVPGSGWLAHDYAPQGEHLVYETADFQVNIQLTSPTSADGQPLIIAASAPAARDGDWFRYQHRAARNFAWSVSDQFQTLNAKVGDVNVWGYAFSGHPSANAPALQTAATAIALFSQIFSPYPHKSFSVVEADFLNGMEFDGLIFLSHAFYDYYTGTPQNNLVIIAAHETAHQWWFGLVGNDQALEPWLDEALATYSEILYYEQVYPVLVKWWWDNRVYFHDPQGWVDSTIYATPDFYPYRDAIYLRGALFLNDLRQQIGDQVFMDFLHDYLARYTYRIATGDDFFAVLQEHTSSDLSGLVAQYFQNRP